MTLSKRTIMMVSIAAAMALCGEVMAKNSPEDRRLWEGDALQTAFAGVGDVVVMPLGLEQIEDAGIGLHFYVGWGSSEARTYAKLSETVHKFRGKMTWLIRPEFNYRGAFISALPLQQAKQAFQTRPTDVVSLDMMHEEIRKFCAFAGPLLNAREATNATREELAASAESFEDSEYRVFLVAQPQKFVGQPTSSSDVMLHFGITKQEWELLLTEEAVRTFGTSPKGRFLAQLARRYEIARLSPTETILLQEELANLEPAQAAPSLQGLLKLRRILNEASAKKLGVVFEPKDQ